MTLFLPETLTVGIFAVLLLMTLWDADRVTRALRPLMLLAALCLLGFSIAGLSQTGGLFSSTYRVDLLSQGFKFLLSLAFLFTVLFSNDTFSVDPRKRVECFLFLTSGLLGMMMITSAADLLTLYISLELSAYSLYLLSALRRDHLNAESSVKYLIFGAATSGIFLWGIGLVAGLAGTTSLLEISQKAPTLVSQPAFSLGLLLASLSFLFKLSGFPMHFLAPDVYESASTPVTLFIATASKAAAVAILVRFFMWMGLTPAFVTVLGVLAWISMTLGNSVALVQQDVKRLLAYSSIAQAGYILVGLLAGSAAWYSSSAFYAFAYVLINAGAFFVTILVANSIRHDNPKLSDFDGLAERSPFLALILLLSLLSLAGIPPLIGFTGKWILFSAAMDRGHWFLVLWGVLNSVVSLFYYLTLVKHAYLEKPKTPDRIHLPLGLKIAGVFLFCGIVFLGIYPNFFITFAQNAVAQGLPHY